MSRAGLVYRTVRVVLRVCYARDLRIQQREAAVLVSTGYTQAAAGGASNKLGAADRAAEQAQGAVGPLVGHVALGAQHGQVLLGADHRNAQGLGDLGDRGCAAVALDVQRYGDQHLSLARGHRGPGSAASAAFIRPSASLQLSTRITRKVTITVFTRWETQRPSS